MVVKHTRACPSEYNHTDACSFPLPSPPLVPPPPPLPSPPRTQVVLDCANIGRHDAPEGPLPGDEEKEQLEENAHVRVDGRRVAAALEYFRCVCACVRVCVCGGGCFLDDYNGTTQPQHPHGPPFNATALWAWAPPPSSPRPASAARAPPFPRPATVISILFLYFFIFMKMWTDRLHPPVDPTYTLHPLIIPPLYTPPTTPTTTSTGGTARRRAPPTENVLMRTDDNELLRALIDRGWVATIAPGENDDVTILAVAIREVLKRYI